MLEKIDLSAKMSSSQYQEEMDKLEIEIGELQRQAREMEIPIIIIFEGWDAAGKGTLINNLILPLDPRGFKVYTFGKATEEETFRPFLWRYWNKIPSHGRIAILDRSWYMRVLDDRVNKVIKKNRWRRSYESIKSFEKQLSDGGYLIIKFFIHINKRVQKDRLKKLEKNKATSWRVTEEDWENHKGYKKYVPAIEEMIERTDSDFAPWTIIEGHDKRYATVKVFKTFMNQLRQALEKKQIAFENKKQKVSINDKNLSPSILEKITPSKTMEKKEYSSRLKKAQEKLRELEYKIYLKRLPVVIAYEGWDAAGKGGNIRRLTARLDPRGYEVIPVGAPNEQEKMFHYLWRFWRAFPKDGHIAIFDRSWYGRVLVERIEGFATEREWKRSYSEINEMEKHWCDHGSILVKFWLHIDKETQLQRFEQRKNIPYKQWKITDDDWRNREKWDEYKAAADEMLLRTSTTYAPWTVVESNNKYFARVKTIETVIEAIDKKLH